MSLPKPYFQDSYVTIYHGDCKEILPLIPDKSIDLVLTDPPYEAELKYIYGLIAEQGSRLLRDGSFLYAYCGTIYLPEVIQAMSNHLDWFWLHNIRLVGGYPRIWSRHIMQSSRVVLAFTNGKPKIDTNLRWVFSDCINDHADKNFHEWGQGIVPAMEYIQCRTENNAIVLDPCMGGGTILMASKKLNRKCIGIEIEEKYCEIATRRLSQSVMRLEV